MLPHPFKAETTEIIPEIGAFPVLFAKKDGIFPLPDAGNPIDAFEFVQLNVALVTLD